MVRSYERLRGSLVIPSDRAALVAQARKLAGHSAHEEPSYPNQNDAARYLHILADALEEDERALLQHHRFIVAWDICESNRGRYSCSPAHDSRCRKNRDIGECTCGGDELDAARNAIAEHDEETGNV